ncbi:hypothetical protein [Vibrio sp. YIC-376]|uniref:hypothetical protein n=1 Tax=Vibrio sp. YIC-376 TaxID=3136162 RepID=UPI00402ADE87
MKQHKFLFVTLLSVSTLWGCNSDNDENTQVECGVYSGVIWAGNGLSRSGSGRGTRGYRATTIEVDNDSLVSINVQTGSDPFP